MPDIHLVDYVTIIGIISLIAFMWKLSRDTHKIVNDEADDNHKRVSRLYGRLDEVKEGAVTKYVSKEVCEVLHKSLRDDVKEIKLDVKSLLKKNGVG